MNSRLYASIVAAGASLTIGESLAQPVLSPEIELEAASDRRNRGLSWSDGKPVAAVFAAIPATPDLNVDLEAVTLRSSRRHGGADLGLTIAPRYTFGQGGWRFGAGLRGNVFVGRAGMSYVEMTGEAEYTLGPARIVAAVDFAPSQSAIGGSNLHVEGRAQIGIPNTALSVYAGVGHTSGSTRGTAKTVRLRPDGSYVDHHFGIAHSKGKLTLGLQYSDTSISTDALDTAIPYVDEHVGANVMVYLRVRA